MLNSVPHMAASGKVREIFYSIIQDSLAGEDKLRVAVFGGYELKEVIRRAVIQMEANFAGPSPVYDVSANGSFGLALIVSVPARPVTMPKDEVDDPVMRLKNGVEILINNAIRAKERVGAVIA